MIADPAQLRILHYPDPRLRQVCPPVTQFGNGLRGIVARMRELMETGKGVGLAATQVGLPLRLFVMSVSGKPGEEMVLVNPAIRDAHGSAEAEEGCLSLPGINVKIRRAQECLVTAQDIDGNPLELRAEDLTARICQHETDHLNGVLIIDRMGPTDKIATRKTLRALEDQFRTSSKARSSR